jgi:hypothetical protein
MKSLLLIGLALVFGSGTFAQAQTRTSDHPPTSQLQVELEALMGSLSSRNEVTQALQKGDFAQVAQKAIEFAIKELIGDLRDRHDDVMADELLQKWESQQNLVFEYAAGLVSLTDIGDHAPLFKWMEDFLTRMAGKYGDIIFKLPFVEDLRTLNFSIPVVFFPKGNWRMNSTVNTAKDRIEYRKHFIPFANIVTFYSANYGCIYVIKKYNMDNLNNLCNKAATQLKFVMGRYIAPQLSDWIFNATNHQRTVSSRRMVYHTPEELKQAIQGGN